VSSTDLLPSTVQGISIIGFDVDHYWCCNPDVAVCGEDLTEEPECLEDHCGHPICSWCKKGMEASAQPCCGEWIGP
jgi:hypothetical protein